MLWRPATQTLGHIHCTWTLYELAQLPAPQHEATNLAVQAYLSWCLYIYVATVSHTRECNYHITQPCTCSVRRVTSQNKMETIGIKLESPVVQYSQHLDAIASQVRLQPTRKEHCYAYISISSNLGLIIFLQQLMTTCALLHEVMPIIYDLVHKPYTVQMPCTFLAFSSLCHNFCRVLISVQLATPKQPESIVYKSGKVQSTCGCLYNLRSMSSAVSDFAQIPDADSVLFCWL